MGALLVRNPFREIEKLARGVESRFPRLFEDFAEGKEEFFPPIECLTKNGNLMVRADVPGMEAKDIDVSVMGNVLTIKGERKAEKEDKKDNYYRREISYGSFDRRMTLPEGAMGDKVKAVVKNGVMEITIPIGKEAATKKVAVETA
ncbi:MAG TPA: Hsp20/alpha crystallin family protein [Candidatus Binataceae bacterium]|nr:Hsp20/alpha crystallin family protein [Candidatus Binataceae bacterium]